MPLVIKKEENNVLIYIWKIQDSLEELIQVYPNLEFPKFKSNKRNLESICSRILLYKHSKNLKISYCENGSPLLNNHQYISISHSGNLVCIAISDNIIGLDIDEISEKSKKIQSKFVNPNQTNLTENKTSLIWCIKESVFKFHKKGDVNFKKDILLKDFVAKSKGKLLVKFRKNCLKAYYFKIENKYLVYVCK